MPLANYTEYVSRTANSVRQLQSTKSSITTVAGRSFSLWAAAPLAGVAPTTPVIPTATTAGALAGLSDSAVIQRLAQAEMMQSSSGTLIIADRLSHMGGLSGTVTGMVTTNLPTSPLTRYTNGTGVWAALDIYTALGTTATTARIRYTSDTGAVDVLSPFVAIGAEGQNEANRSIIMPLYAGHRGVRSVSGVELTATTGTAGNYGVTLFKPLLLLPMQMVNAQVVFDAMIGLYGSMPRIENGACLYFILLSSGTASGVRQIDLNLIEV